MGSPGGRPGARDARVLTRKTHDETAEAPERELAAPAADRFERRRADIVSAAIPVLNGQGFKGMRLTAVAELIGLRATGVTYYFPRKEELAVAWQRVVAADRANLEKSAAAGDSRSLVGLALAKLDRQSTDYAPQEAQALLEKAVAAGDPEAKYRLAQVLDVEQILRDVVNSAVRARARAKSSTASTTIA